MQKVRSAVSRILSLRTRAWVHAIEVDAWSGVGVGEVNVLTSVVRSMVENVSSPTLLMRDVMKSVWDVVVRDVGVLAAFAVLATLDTPLIPVTSNTVMAELRVF